MRLEIATNFHDQWVILVWSRRAARAVQRVCPAGVWFWCRQPIGLPDW